MDNQRKNIKSDFMGVMDISVILGLSKSVVYRLIHSGELPSYKVGGTIKVKADDFQTYMERCRQG
ncbi:helix-turn-helix domain-containing protein [Tautonia sociabilis]|uniref:DNA-binding protein n=1 Tax=Tautonia sociabilis TaxID=2080755 RepID=A0A432ML73_9BACT|nr:helix-turn-helix domain-containing protein [Tautonia sociabilis]RUL88173.1 DNA-binding protein [Tautonia sociabilis]